MSTFLIAHIPRRRSYEAAHSKLLHILAHIDAYKSVGAVKQVFGELLRKMRLSDTGRTEEHECSYRFVGILKSDTITLYGLHNLVNRLVLPDNVVLEFRAQLSQTHTLGLGYALHGHTGHHRHDLGYFLFINHLAYIVERGFPFTLSLVEFLLQTMLLVAERSRRFKILILCSL